MLSCLFEVGKGSLEGVELISFWIAFYPSDGGLMGDVGKVPSCVGGEVGALFLDESWERRLCDDQKMGDACVELGLEDMFEEGLSLPLKECFGHPHATAFSGCQ